MLKYEHMGYGSTYEKDLLIDIEQGVVKEVNIIKNGVSDNPNAAEGFGVAAFTTFNKKRLKIKNDKFHYWLSDFWCVNFINEIYHYTIGY